jgi:outer membrane protein assembly factor BamA
MKRVVPPNEAIVVKAFALLRSIPGNPWRYILWATIFLMLPAPRAMADTEYMDAEENIAEFLPTVERIDYLLPARIPGESQPLPPDKRQWALLPQIGYGPDTGVMGGVKFSHRNIFRSGTSFDVNGLYGLKGRQSFTLSLGSPHLANNRLILLLRGRFIVDLTRQFFGLGMNDVGPEPASTHAIQDAAGAITVGWRPFQHIAFDFSLGARNVQIWCPSNSGSTPCTKSEFSNLPGIDGGWVNYLGLSAVWDDSDSIVRPTRGWRFIVKVVHTNNLLLGPYEFTRFVGDASYLRAFLERRLILGMRINGEWIAGPHKKIPFWELSELGGSDTLRGFESHRFVGTRRFLVNAEVRYALTEFDFIHLWHIRIDGVLFGDGGRVFIDEKDLSSEFGIPPDNIIIKSQTGGFEYSYGPGLRIALSQVLVARIDVGFSEENKGLVFLSFGQVF